MTKEQNNAHRKKTVIVATVALIVVLVIGIWAISSALSSVSKNDSEVAESDTSKNTSVVENTDTPTTTDTTADSANNTDTTNNTNTTSTGTIINLPTTTSPSSQYDASNIPATGPVDLTISAIALGVIVGLIIYNVELTKKLAKRNI